MCYFYVLPKDYQSLSLECVCGWVVSLSLFSARQTFARIRRTGWGVLLQKRGDRPSPVIDWFLQHTRENGLRSRSLTIPFAVSPEILDLAGVVCVWDVRMNRDVLTHAQPDRWRLGQGEGGGGGCWEKKKKKKKSHKLKGRDNPTDTGFNLHTSRFGHGFVPLSLWLVSFASVSLLFPIESLRQSLWRVTRLFLAPQMGRE